MVKVENWEKQVRKFDDSRFVYLWKNLATGEQLLLQRMPDKDATYGVFVFTRHEELSFLDGEKVGSADTQREGKTVATEYMKRNVF
jgi:hypothetical protein